MNDLPSSVPVDQVRETRLNQPLGQPRFGLVNSPDREDGSGGDVLEGKQGVPRGNTLAVRDLLEHEAAVPIGEVNASAFREPKALHSIGLAEIVLLCERGLDLAPSGFDCLLGRVRIDGDLEVGCDNFHFLKRLNCGCLLGVYGGVGLSPSLLVCTDMIS